MNAHDNGYWAFPQPMMQQRANGETYGAGDWDSRNGGMTLRDWFAGQALANPAICSGAAPDYELRRWFGGRGGITRAEIVAAQAHDYADAMLAARQKVGS